MQARCRDSTKKDTLNDNTNNDNNIYYLLTTDCHYDYSLSRCICNISLSCRVHSTCVR